MTMRWSLQDLSCRDRPLVSGDDEGLQGFFLLGWVNESPAVADWDGACLRISDALFDVASLAVEVDQVFADTDADLATVNDAEKAPGCPASLSDTPARALLTLAEACDGIYVLETVDHQGRRTW
jgi:hypothetical protein